LHTPVPTTLPNAVPRAPETAAEASPAPRGAARPWRARLRPVAVAAVLAGGLGGGGLVWAAVLALPAFDTLKDYKPLVATRVYGIDGSEVFEFYRERRTIVPFEEIPDVVKKAVLASEDAKFYEHGGVNYLAIARCAVRGVFRGRVGCGGSTITQQVVKTFLLQNEWRPKRKLEELVLAPRLEKNLTKDEILFLYLSQIYFGHHRYGVEEASRFFFNKSVRALTIGEAALLAGVVQSPERLSPVKHPQAAKERQKYVLRRMAEEGFISPKVAEAEMARPLAVQRRTEESPGAWYADAVRKYLDERYGAERVETDGLVVDAAMDPAMQRSAEEAVTAQLRAVDKRQGWRGAPSHLDEPQVRAAMPLWRERLKAAQPRPGEVLVWDLGHVSKDDIEPGAENQSDIRRMASVKPLAVDGLYNALVTTVTERGATVDLGNATGLLTLGDVAWARKWNPTSGTALPRRMNDVVKPGDIVLVRVAASKPGPLELARAGKPVAVALEQVPKVQGALVAIDPRTRGVRALVGGYDFGTSQFNRAYQAKRQPGSAFKPFVWGAAVETRHYTAATLVYDTPDLYRDPWTGKEWKPQNFERDEYDGGLLLKAALAHSKNTVSVKLVNALGVDAVIGFARRCGIQSELPRTLSIALGVGEVTPLDLVNAYTTIAARGFATPPLLVLRVRDRKGNVLEENKPAVLAVAMVIPAATAGASPTATAAPDPATASAAPVHIPESGLDPDVAYVLTTMMRDVIEYGTGAGARVLGRPLAGKTGTAQEHRDAWFVGFSPDVVTGVWVGFDSHDPLGPRETGAGAALPAWIAFMREAHARRPPADFEPPPNVTFARVDPKTGLLADAAAADAPLVAFIAGTAPTRSTADAQTGAPQNFFMDDR
jgi:penicillin-binding protein 1A